MNVPCILFTVEGTTYAVRASIVHVVDMLETVTRVPNAPSWVDGLVSVRGQVVPVVNLRLRFGFAPRPYDMSSRLIVVNLDERLLGLAVDAAREFVSLDLEGMKPPPDALKSQGNEAVEGILTQSGRMILVLNPQRLLHGHELITTAS